MDGLKVCIDLNNNTNDLEEKSCGKCGTCVERLEAFEQNNLKDPVEYI